MSKRNLIAPVVVLLALSAGGAAYRFRPAPAMDVVNPAPREVVELVVASGRLRAVRQSDVGPDLTGTVESVAVDEGDTVAAGDLLVTLAREDAAEALAARKLAVATAAAQLEQARRGPLPTEKERAEAEVARAEAVRRDAAREATRQAELFRQGLTPQADRDAAATALERSQAEEGVARGSLRVLLDQPRPEDVHVAEARLAEAEAAVRVAERDLARREIRAPLAGLVVARSVEPGQSVTPGDALLTIADMNRTEIRVETDESNLPRLRVGQPAVVVAPAWRDRPFQAQVTQIGPDVDSDRGVVQVRLTPGPLPEYVRPDMTVDVSVEVARLPDALSLPLSCVLREGSRDYVYAVADGGEVARRDIRVVGRSAEYAAVEGLAPGDQVVLHGTDAAEGQTVRPRPAHDTTDG